jgi:hypothetical protein
VVAVMHRGTAVVVVHREAAAAADNLTETEELEMMTMWSKSMSVR